MNKRILILCTGNSCRSQMAEGFLKSFSDELVVYSAGTEPTDEVHPKAIKVMNELGIDISNGIPQHVNEYVHQGFDFVVTVCGGAQENCPVFSGDVKQKIHIGFDDPAEATGTEEEILAQFRIVRDKIKHDFNNFYKNLLG